MSHRDVRVSETQSGRQADASPGWEAPQIQFPLRPQIQHPANGHSFQLPFGSGGLWLQTVTRPQSLIWPRAFLVPFTGRSWATAYFWRKAQQLLSSLSIPFVLHRNPYLMFEPMHTLLSLFILYRGYLRWTEGVFWSVTLAFLCFPGECGCVCFNIKISLKTDTMKN